MSSCTARNVFLLCLLYTSDAADDMQCVDLGGRRIIKKGKRVRTLCGSDPLSQSLAVLFFQAEDGIRDVERSRGLGDVYKRQATREWCICTSTLYGF